MENKRWKITTTKDTMLHIFNNVFKQDVKENMTKENMIKLIPDLYKGENLIEVIKMISYEAYEALEKILKYVEGGLELEEAIKKSKYIGNNLEEVMIIVMRISGRDAKYSLNVDPNELAPMFSKENKRLAKKYDKIEKIVTGLIYSYGIIEIETLRKMVCKCLKEIIPEDDIYGFIFKRLDLNLLIDYHYIHWENNGQDECYVSYIRDEEIDVSKIAAEQKGRGLNYKTLKEDEILARTEDFWNDNTEKFYEYLKSRNGKLEKDHFKLFVKLNEYGENVLEELMMIAFIYNEKDVNEFMFHFMEWYNNAPQYMLCGYSPNEMLDVE